MSARSFRRAARGVVVASLGVLATTGTASAAEIRHCTFTATDVAAMSLVSAATREGDVLQLNTASLNNGGAAWETTKVALTATTSFRTHFEVRIHSPGGLGPGGDGMTFVLQNHTEGDGGPTGALSIGGGGGGMGYLGIGNSVAVELDTFPGSADTNDNHVAYMTGGTLTPLVSAQPSFDMNASPEQIFHVWIDYDGVAKSLKTYVSLDRFKPTTPLVQATVDVFAAVGSSAWVGFTGVAGQAWEAHQVREWIFTTESTGSVQCGCASDAECPASTPRCLSTGACGGCVADTSCTFRADSTVCRTSDGACVECTTGKTAACVSPEALCNVAAGTCAGCVTNADCPTQALAACTNDVCGGCTADAQCTRFFATPFCHLASAVCSACATDLHCGALTSGRICAPNACVDGCRGSGGNGCPTGKVCTSTTSAPGTCVTPDAGPDTFVPDTAPDDTFIPDTFVEDTFVQDTFIPDTFVQDTFVQDTFVADTSIPDTSIPDTSAPDSAAIDAPAADTMMADAFAEPGESPVDEGCGCRVEGQRRSAALSPVAVVFGLALLRRRRGTARRRD